MGKYDYDKSALRGLGVGPFLNEVKVREQHIAEASADEIRTEFNANVIAKKLHPEYQYVKISKVEELLPDAKAFTFVPDKDKGTEELAFFRAGQYISVYVKRGGTEIPVPYTIASDPKYALRDKSSYRIVLKRTPNGVLTNSLLDNWKKGDKVKISSPHGEFYYQELRDSKHVVGIAGGSGITPFLSMAHAICSGAEDFKLTIIYGSRTSDGILCKDELDKLAKSSAGKVRVVHVLSDEKKPPYEHGFITADLIKKTIGKGEFSIFVCGPAALYAFIKKEAAKLGLTPRRARFELPGYHGDPSSDEGFPAAAVGRTFNVKVLVHGKEYNLTCPSNQTLLVACLSNGIAVESRCHSGLCGWCHSRLISGDIYMPASVDGRREADKKFGWIHPCASYPISDIVMEVFPKKC